MTLSPGCAEVDEKAAACRISSTARSCIFRWIIIIGVFLVTASNKHWVCCLVKRFGGL